MRIPKLIHYVAVAGLLYWTGITARDAIRSHPGSAVDGLTAEAPMILMWFGFAIMVFLKPKTWGLWVGILILFGVGSMASSWHGAAADTHLDSGWSSFLLWAAPNLITAPCCIALRWLGLEKDEMTAASE